MCRGVLETEDLIPGPSVALFDYAFQRAYLRFADVAATGIRVAFRHRSQRIVHSPSPLTRERDRDRLPSHKRQRGHRRPARAPDFTRMSTVGVRRTATAVSARELRAYLGSLSGEELVDLVVEATRADVRFAQRVTLSAATAGPETATTIATYRAAIRAAVGDGFVEWDDVWNYTSDLEATVDSIDALLATGSAAAVVELTEEFIALVEDAIDRVHDDSDQMTMVLERLSELHLAACRKAKPDRVALAERLLARELSGEWGVFDGAAHTYRTVLGKPGRARLRELAESEWEQVPERAPGEDRHDRRAARLAAIMEALAGNDLDALVAVKSRDLSRPERFVQIAELYAEADEHDTALAWAQNALDAFGDAPGSQLRAFLAAEYARRGRHDDAIAIARAEFQDRPAINSYHALRERAQAGDRWPEVRDQARAWLRARLATARRQASRKPDPWRGPADFSALVEILLSEEDVEAAWSAAVEAAWSAAVEGDCDEALWLDLARRRRDKHPVDAQAVFQRLAEAAIERKGEHRYDVTIARVRKAGALMSAADFAAYRADLCDRYSRKRNLVTKLEGLA